MKDIGTYKTLEKSVLI